MLGTFHAVCHRAVPTYTPTQYTKASFPPHPPNFGLGLLDGSCSHRCEVPARHHLICIPLIIRDDGRLFTGLLAICVSSLETRLLNASADFVMFVFIVELWELFISFGC